MKFLSKFVSTLSIVSALCLLTVPFPVELSASDSGERLNNALKDYNGKMEQASRDLATAREKIGSEKVVLARKTHELEDELVALQVELLQLKTLASDAENLKQKVELDFDALERNFKYLNSLALDGAKRMADDLLPGEAEIYSNQNLRLTKELEKPVNPLDGTAVEEATALQFQRFLSQIGGYTAPGKALLVGDNKLKPGQFIYLGPESLFLSDNGTILGTVRKRSDSDFPVVYPNRAWSSRQANALFSGGLGSFPADVTGGKALKLQEVKGNWVDHVKQGGVVGYVIIGLGVFALLTGLLKLVDLSRLSVSNPFKVRDVLILLAAGSLSEVESAVARLRKTNRELFEIGIRNLAKKKDLLEEHLYSYILRQRIHHERRLPLIRVIAAAAPLLGLLGTVVGMIKTFTLITIYGTGDASKLSSGISEALVTTELGLIVAIPALVIHGYLSQRTQRSLALLEQYAVEFVNAAEDYNNTGKTEDETTDS